MSFEKIISDPFPLKAMLGDYDVTHALRHGKLKLKDRDIDFADVKVPNTAFKRTVRDLEFDFSELAIVTFLQAKEAGIPLSLLPCVVVSRFQHPYLMYNTKFGELKPKDIKGKRIGVRSYPVTTVTWLRGMLMQEYGILPSDNHWYAFEAPHVAQWKDPSWVRNCSSDQDMLEMLEKGELDVAVLGSAPLNTDIQPVFNPPELYSKEWAQKHQVIQINHMIVVKDELCQSSPEIVANIFDLFKESKRLKMLSKESAENLNIDYPMGIKEVKPHLEFVIDLVNQQGLTKTSASLESLFHQSTFFE